MLGYTIALEDFPIVSLLRQEIDVLGGLQSKHLGQFQFFAVRLGLLRRFGNLNNVGKVNDRRRIRLRLRLNKLVLCVFDRRALAG